MRGAKASDPQVAPVDRSPSLHKISPLQQYILEQAKLSGYRLRRWSYSNKPSNTGLLRFGDKVLAEKRDSFIDSENESHRTGSCIQQKFPKENSWKTYLYVADNATFPGDDSDAFADDEAPSSDGMEERDDISLVSTVSSVRTNLFFFSLDCVLSSLFKVGEDDNYLSEPTYNNLDPLWARRHGFGPGGKMSLSAK